MARPKMDRTTEAGVAVLEKTQEEMKNLTVDEINKAPVVETESQTLMTRAQIEKTDAPVIKPVKSFPPAKKGYDPKERKERERGWEYVKCIAENLEVVGETIEFWHNKFKGDPIYFWQVPVNKPVYLPRFVAEHLSTRHYHRFKMQDRSQQEVMHGDVAQKMVVQETLRRLDCRSAEFGLR